MKPTRWGRVCLVVFAFLVACVPAFGQTTGGIRGEVKDPSGAIVQGATVTATQVSTASSRSSTTGQDGNFDIPELAVGTYSVTAEAQGFKKAVTKDVVVSIGHVNVVNITLQIGGSTDTVTVEANAAQVETTSTQLGAVMTDTAIRALPLSTRNTYQLLQLQPGVQSQVGADLFFGSDSPGVVSVNGGRGRSNNYMVNGGDGNDIFVNSPAIQPSPDAVEEFRVLTNTFDAEYGRNSGSVVNVVTKSGTNSVHGDFYDFLRNNVLNTKGYFDPSVAKYIQNQFGATLGAPIKKDKTFIFGSYEGNRLRQGISSGNVFLPTTVGTGPQPGGEAGGDFSGGPTFAGTLNDQNFAQAIQSRAGCAAALTPGGQTALAQAAAGNTPQPYSTIFAGNQIPTQCFDPTALDLYNQFIKPIQPAIGNGVFTAVPVKQDRGDQVTFRFDHHINPNQVFSAYYYFNDETRTEPFSGFQGAGANVPGFGALFKTRIQQWNLSHTWTLGSTAVNEFRFNYFREGQGNLDHPLHVQNTVHESCKTVPAAFCFSDPANPQAGITTNIPGRVGVPYINVSGGFVIGNNFEGELPQKGNTFQWTDNFTKTIGRHTIKFGADVRRQRFDQFLYFNISGEYLYFTGSGNDVGASDLYPNYFIGQPGFYSQGAAQAENVRNTALYLFAQDSYKLKSNLTLNYGLRWELNTPYYDLGNRLQTFRPGAINTKYPCLLNPTSVTSNNLIGIYGSADCSPNGPAGAVFPTGLVFPGDPGVPRGLTTTYYKAWAPRVGLAYSPDWTDGWLAKLSGGPGKSSIRMGFGLFYNPIEQLVLEQFSAEPPFGGSSFLSNTMFNLPFEFQAGGNAPNAFGPVITQTPQTPCFDPTGPKGCVDFANFRPLLLFGEFQPHLRTQYADQYNLTLERQLGKAMVLRVAYVGTQAHRLLASRDVNAGNIQACLGLANLAAALPNNVLTAPASAGGVPTACGSFNEDSSYFITPGTVIPAGISAMPPQPFKVPSINCSGLVLPYSGAGGGNPTCLAANSVVGPNGITLVGTRPYSSPNCVPSTGVGCPADGIPVFSNIFAQDTIAASNYNGLQISFDRSFSRGLLFQASYTFSKAIDQGASFENLLNSLNSRATRGLSLLDARHRFVFSPYWQLPIPKHDGFAGKVVNGWAVSGIVTYQSGFPIRIQTQNDVELQSSFDFEVVNTPQVTGPVHFLNPKKNGNIWLDASNISDPTVPGQFGNLPHALCCGPAISNTDLAIEKRTPINERFTTEFRAEFFNTWNHTQFANPDGNFTDVPPPGGTFGVITKTREGPRVIQFGLKVLF
ncbi:MAG: carboxypeptidase regulatory-like domain-containing protein [Candidatus Acidiferrales bacterium]